MREGVRLSKALIISLFSASRLAPLTVVSLLCWGSALSAREPVNSISEPTAISFRLADPQVAAIEVDRLLSQELPAPTARNLRLADDYAFLRRATLDLVGTLPTPQEIHEFVLDPAEDKRAHLVEQLLSDRRYGENWGRYWRDVIFYRRSEDRALMGASAATEFLAKQLNANTPWDEIATAFVTAEGDVRHHGETAIILAQSGRPEETVAEISRIFMGIQIQCAQCHDHPYDRWEREQFHELAAFFPRVGLRPVRAEGQRSFAVISSDLDRPVFRPLNNRHRPVPEHRMPNLDDPTVEGKLMTPTFFVSGDSVDLGTPDADRRAALASWITSSENEWFAKAFVNRMWSELMGVGFFEPVDDIGPEREPTAGRTLDFLATAFAESGYDAKWLVRTITATEAYGRASASRSETDGPAEFLTTNPQRMRADQLFNALTSALFVDEERLGRGASGAGTPRRPPGRNLRMMFSAIFGYDPSRLRTDVSGSVPQALTLMNSPIVDRLISARRWNGLGGMLRLYPDNRRLIRELYLRCFSRPPTKGELDKATKYVSASEDRASGFEDLLWALLNSAEFRHRT